MMYPWYYISPYMPYPPDPLALMGSLMSWMIWPYYYALMFETYKVALETWRKALEALPKSLEVSKQ